MPYRTFFIPVRWPREAEAELNAFLAAHQIIEIERRWNDQGEQSSWCFCVEYLEHRKAPTASVGAAAVRERIDYRERLSPSDFRLYCLLTDWRRDLAAAHAIPPYMVFTNEQLAKIVELRVSTKADLEKIDGVGDARIEKFGEQVLTVISKMGAEPDASSGPTV
jgi:superfamily II DNA helicase RecQ